MGIPNIQCGIAPGVNLEGLIDALADEGWHPKRLEPNYVGFRLNDKNYVAACPEGEENLLVLCAPRIYRISKYDDRAAILETVNEINCNSRVGKIYIYDDAVWVNVEVRHLRMGMAAALLTTYIEDITAVVKAFNIHILTTADGQPETLQ